MTMQVDVFDERASQPPGVEGPVKTANYMSRFLTLA